MRTFESSVWGVLGILAACSGAACGSDAGADDGSGGHAGASGGSAAGGAANGGATASGGTSGSAGNPASGGASSGGSAGEAGAGASGPGGAGGSSGSGGPAPWAYCPFDTGANQQPTFDGKPVVRVCPPGDSRVGCDVSTIKEGVALLADGDRLEVVAGAAYQTCDLAIAASNVDVVGVCGTPTLTYQGCPQAGKKGILITKGSEIRLENLELTGQNVSDGNGAGVRHEGGNLLVRYTFMHDGQQGILTSGISHGALTIQHARFERLGADGQAHGIYVNRATDQLLIQNSLFLRSKDQGHEVKSRAQKTTIECSVLASLDGADSYSLDLPNGGQVLVKNSVLQQGKPSVNNSIMTFSSEAGTPTARNFDQSLVMQNNIIIDDRGTGTFLRFRQFAASASNAATVFELTQNQLVGFDAADKLLSPIEGSMPETVVTATNAIFATRAAAGLAASADQLPAPPDCPQFEWVFQN
jgi:hypothetical protein